MLNKILCATLATLMLFTPILAQNAENACAQAQMDAQTDINSTLWFMAGCLVGIIGWGAAYVIEPNPKATRLIGKSPEYVAAYTDCYTETAKKIQTKQALNGCLIGTVLSVALQVMAASAISTSTQ